MSKKNNVLLGTVLGSILGSVSAAMIPKNKDALGILNDQKNKWTDKARKVSEKLYHDVTDWTEPKSDVATRNFIAGALVGLLVGAGSTAMLTPKSGKQLRRGISDKYHNVADKTQEVLDFINEYAGSAKPAVKKALKNAKNAVNGIGVASNKLIKKVTAKSATRSPRKKAAKAKSRASSARTKAKRSR